MYVGQHGAFFASDPAQHAAIVLVPDDPSAFVGVSLFHGPYDYVATLGAQPSGYDGSGLIDPFGTLLGEANYPGDAVNLLHDLTLVATPAGMTDTQFITTLLAEFGAYGNALPYEPFPSGGNGTYNSNGFVSGLLIGAGATPPILPGYQPGYNNPIPNPLSKSTGQQTSLSNPIGQQCQ